MMKRQIAYALLLMSLIWSAQAIPTSLSQPIPAKDVLAEANAKSLQIYDQLKEKYTQRTDPLIIVWSNRLSFYNHHSVQEFPIISPEYVDLKTVAHVILALFALFNQENNFPDNMAIVKDYQTQIARVLAVVDELALTAEQKNRQKIILKKTQNFLQQALVKKRVNQKELQDFFSSLSPDIMRNIDEAARNQLSLVNQQMTKIQQQLTSEAKAKLFVILPGVKMPRQENILGQYFSKYLNEKMDSKRLIYAEGLTDTQQVLTLVGTWQLDSVLSAEFFHNSERMEKDVLADNAKRYLQGCKVDVSGKQALICDS